MNWKRVISGVLAAAMLSALPVQLLASAEGAEAAAEVNTWEDLTSVESLERTATPSTTTKTAIRLKSSLTRKRTSRSQTASWTIWAMAQWTW